MDRTLITAALNFRRSALFETLDDSQIFAVSLQDGSIGYCCCMGHAGQHYGLALYHGSKGFDTYLHSINAGHTINPLEMFERQMTFHAVNCDYENASDCLTRKEDRAFIKKVADKAGITLSKIDNARQIAEFWMFMHAMMR